MISIVTINKNNALGLSSTISSLNIQTEKHYQWVLIDGNSSDSSLSVTSSCTGDDVTIISEPDLGIYDAMNKGVNLCKFPYILFLNSGDKLANQFVLEDIVSNISDGVDILLGGFSVRGKVRFPRPNWWRYWSLPTSHQSIIYAKSLLTQYPFDLSFTRAADFEHYLQINKTERKISTLRSCLVINEIYGSDNFLPLVLEEYRLALIKNNCPWIWASLVKFIKQNYLRIVLN